MTLQDVYEAILGQLGVLVLLLVILYGGYKRWWIFGWYAKILEDQNKRLEDKIDRALKQSERVTSVAENTVRAIETKQVETARDA